MREEQDIDPASHHQQLEDNTQEAIIFRSRNHRKQSRPCYHMHFPLETPSRLTTSDQASWSALVLAPESLCPWTPPPRQTGMVVPSPKEETQTQTMTYVESPRARGQGDLEGSDLWSSIIESRDPSREAFRNLQRILWSLQLIPVSACVWICSSF